MKTRIASWLLAMAVTQWLGSEAQAQLTVNTLSTSGLNEPSGLAVDAAGNLYIVDSGNDRIVRMDATYLTLSVFAGTGTAGYKDGAGYAAMFNNPQGVLLADTNTLVVTDSGNNLVRSVRLSDARVTTLAGQTNAGPAVNATGPNATFHFPVGLTTDGNGNIYIADWGNSAVRVMNWYDPAFGVTNVGLSGAPLNRPWALAFGGTNQLWVADDGSSALSDNTIRLFSLATPIHGSLTTFMGGNSPHVQAGFQNAPVGGTNVLFHNPKGLLWIDGFGLLICDAGNNCVRLATNNPVYGATNYAVTTFAGVPGTAGTADGSASSATFSAPNSMVLNSGTSFYLSDNAPGIASPLRSLQNGSEDFTPVPTPVVGYVVIDYDYFYDLYFAYLETNLPATFYNDPVIVVADTPGFTIHFTYGTTSADFPDPTETTNYYSVDAYDINNYLPADVPDSIMTGQSLSPSLTIKAIALASSGVRPPSGVVYGEFNFQTATPYNSASDVLDPFHVSLTDLTTNSTIYYTLDGSTPTGNSSSLAWNDSTLFQIPTNDFVNGMATLKAIAIRSGYNNSGMYSQTFFLSNGISDLTLWPNSGYYPMGQSVQVVSPGSNIFYTVDGSEPTTNSLQVTDITRGGPDRFFGTIHWFNTTNDLTSLQVKAFVDQTNSTTTAAGQPVATADIGVPTGFSPQIYAGIGSSIVVPVVCDLATGQTVRSYQFRLEIAPVNNTNTPEISPLSIVPTNDFQPLVTAAQSGYVASNSAVPYSYGVTNGLEFYALGSGTHILFQNYAVIGLLEVKIPYEANLGDTYALDVLYPSATADAYNTPVTLTPLSAMTILVTNLPYLVGDSASTVGSWYDAGTFGDGNLDNSDVNQAFYAASGLRVPYFFSDVFNAMDAYPSDADEFVGGDGQIRYLDWMTILERSLRFDLNNWAREWSADGVLIDYSTNLVSAVAKHQAEPKTKDNTPWPWYRQVLLGLDSVGNAGANTKVSLPVYALVSDGASVSGLQFRAVVTPRNGAPELTVAPTFVMAGSLGNPLLSQSFSANQAAFGWSLGSVSYGEDSSNFLGWVTFTVPTNAAAGQTYQVSLQNADGAPNLTTQYDFETRSATVAVNSDAPAATICSDEWKVYFFGSATNAAAADNADPDGDGVPNWMEFLAGTDPTKASSKLTLAGVAGQGRVQLNWLTAPGRLYSVQWSGSLNGGAWNMLTNVSGNGYTTNFSDTNPNRSIRFYRLQVLP